MVFALGFYDRNVVAFVRTSSVQQDFPTAYVYHYAARHGVSINAAPRRCKTSWCMSDPIPSAPLVPAASHRIASVTRMAATNEDP